MTKTPSIPQQLDTFQSRYPSIRVTRHEDMLVYSCSWGWVEDAVRLANRLIKRLELDLIAQKETETSYSVSHNATRKAETAQKSTIAKNQYQTTSFKKRAKNELK